MVGVTRAVIASLLLGVAGGSLYVFGLFAPELKERLKFEQSEINLLFSAGKIYFPYLFLFVSFLTLSFWSLFVSTCSCAFTILPSLLLFLLLLLLVILQPSVSSSHPLLLLLL